MISVSGMTPKKKKAFLWICKYITENGYSPIYKEIEKGLSTGQQAAHCFVLDLMDMGLMDKPNDKTERGIWITELGKEYFKEYGVNYPQPSQRKTVEL